MCPLPPISKQSRLSVKTLREQTLQVHGTKLFNKLPWEIRNMTKCTIETFKEKLDTFLNEIPDQAVVADLVPTPCNLATGKASNSLMEWIPHLFKDLRRPKGRKIIQSLTAQ